MLEMRAVCERCEAPLAEDSTDAWICSFECTWCTTCFEGELAGVCPNCGGELRPRPRRASAG
jgi:hypothetical protein